MKPLYAIRLNKKMKSTLKILTIILISSMILFSCQRTDNLLQPYRLKKIQTETNPVKENKFVESVIIGSIYTIYNLIKTIHINRIKIITKQRLFKSTGLKNKDYEIPKVPETETNVQTITIIFGGDVIPHKPILYPAEGLSSEQKKEYFTEIFSNISSIVSKADLAFVNLETPVAQKK